MIPSLHRGGFPRLVSPLPAHPPASCLRPCSARACTACLRCRLHVCLASPPPPPPCSPHQAEEQFTQLRGLIQSSLAAASEAATQRAAGAARDGGAGRAAGQAGEEQPPPPLHKDPRIRSTETISSADADVSAAHPREPSAHHRAFKPPAAKKKPRRAAEPYPEMHSL